jgi:predicted RNase H-like nuclease
MREDSTRRLGRRHLDALVTIGAVKVVGADGFRRGWVAVTVTDGRFAAIDLFSAMQELLETLSGAAVVAVDIPIGIPRTGVRPADQAARRFVGARASSVFATPPRLALEAATYAEARARHPSVSSQAYALRIKILEVDAVTTADERVFEVHPEVSFRALAGHALPPKKTWNGQMTRRAALARVGIVLPDDLGAGGNVPPDDVLDAAGAAWTAGRIASGSAESLPAHVDERIGPIWY